MRLLTADDIGYAMAQMESVDWWRCPAIFESIVRYEPDGCFVEEEDGAPVGMVTTTCYESIAWMGNLIVPPEHRRKGIGQRLMERGLEYIRSRGIGTVWLDADAPGVNIYRRLGFVDTGDSLRFALGSRPDVGATEAMVILPSDIDDVVTFDAPRFGQDREGLIRFWLERSSSAFVRREGGRVVGYAIAMPMSAGTMIAPCVADDADTAECLLRAVIASSPDGTIGLGILADSVDGANALAKLGFEAKTTSLRMVLGERKGEGRPERIVAIGNGATG